MTIARLAERAADPRPRRAGAATTRRAASSPSSRSARASSIEPQIDVEDVEVALELAARGLGDTIAAW